MLTPAQLGWLREHLLDNDVILFIGAGFSSGATNKLGEAFPTSYRLAQQLYEYAEFSKGRPYRNEKLEDMFEAARYKLGEDRLFDFLVPRLSVSSAPPWYGFLADFPWYRMYTTNVDDVVEYAWRTRRGRVPDLQVVIGPEEKLVERDQILGSLHNLS